MGQRQMRIFKADNVARRTAPNVCHRKLFTNLFSNAHKFVCETHCCWGRLLLACGSEVVDFNIYFDQTAQETNRKFLLRPLNDTSLKLLGRSVYSVFIKLNMAAGRDSKCGAAFFPAGNQAPNPVINRHKGAAAHGPRPTAFGRRQRHTPAIK